MKANEQEILYNGYFLCKGNELKEFKLQFGQDIDVPTKTTVLGLFDFRSFLNIGMLLVESEKAKLVRSQILDIVIATINEKTGGGTKYINRRDRDYLPSALSEENYHKNLPPAGNHDLCLWDANGIKELPDNVHFLQDDNYKICHKPKLFNLNL